MNNSRAGFSEDAKKITTVLQYMSLKHASVRGVIAQWMLKDAFFVSSLGLVFTERLRIVQDAAFEEFRRTVSQDAASLIRVLSNVDLRGEALTKPLFTSPMQEVFLRCVMRCFDDMDPFIRDLCRIQQMVYRYDLNDTDDTDRLYAAVKAAPEEGFKSWIGEAFLRALYLRTTVYRADQAKKRAYTVLAAAGVVLFFTSAFGIRMAQYREARTKEQVTEIRELKSAPVVSADAPAFVPEKEPPYDTSIPREGEAYVDVNAPGNKAEIAGAFRTLKEDYPALAGWLVFDGVRVDLPVMWGTDGDFYLTHNFVGEEDRAGSLFISPETTLLPADDLTVVYGHNMRSGAMFGRFKELTSETKVRQNPYFYFDTIYGGGVYEIVAVVKTRVLKPEEEGFRYYRTRNFESERDFEAFADFVRANAVFPPLAEMSFGDHFVLLSTCEYSVEEGRLLVIGRRCYF